MATTFDPTVSTRLDERRILPTRLQSQSHCASTVRNIRCGSIHVPRCWIAFAKQWN